MSYVERIIRENMEAALAAIEAGATPRAALGPETPLAYPPSLGGQSDRELREAREADRAIIRDSASGESDVLDEYGSRISVKAELPGSGLSVELWYGEEDHVPVVQIDGPFEPEHDDGLVRINDDGSPHIRVWINDDLSYDGSAS